MASSAARRVWGGGEHLLDSQPWDRRTHRWTEEQQPSKGRNSGRCSLGHTQMLAMEDLAHRRAGAGRECLGGHRGCGFGGGRGSRVTFLHRSQLIPAPWCSQGSALPSSPGTGGTLQPWAGGSSDLVHFFASRLGGLGGARAGLDGDL